MVQSLVQPQPAHQLATFIGPGYNAAIPSPPHQAIASIGTQILDAGEDIYFAKDWLGHKKIKNTTIYSKFSTAQGKPHEH